jgi:hypothetical protein
MEIYEVRFLYEKAALLLYSKEQRHLVLGDLHLGLERKLYDKGVHLYGTAEQMAKQVTELAHDNKADSIILLGDIKESILYPDSGERQGILEFFNLLKDFEIKIAVGNHDGHLDEIIKLPIENEILLGNVALLHGHMWPSDEAMMKDYLIVAHNHVAISLKDEKDAMYNQKAWLVAKLNPVGAEKRYKKFNAGIKLVVMPAFNDLIIGKPVNMLDERHINPLFRNSVFDYQNANVYTMSGNVIGTPESLSSS